MTRWSIVSAALIVFALNATASADWFRTSHSLLSPVQQSFDGGSHVFQGGAMKGAVQSYGAPYGYPFYSGCCEARRSCCTNLWAGYCGRAHCRHHRIKSWRKSYCGGRHHHRRHSACGCGVPSCGGCSKGGCSTCGHSGLHYPSYSGHSLGCSSCGGGAVISGGKGHSKHEYFSAPMGDSMMEGDSIAPPTPAAPEVAAPATDQSADRRWSPLRFLSL